MSSLLQHHGGRSTDGRKVELLMYRVVKGEKWEEYCGPGAYNPSPNSTTFCDDAEPFHYVGRYGKARVSPRLYRIFRRPVGMCGCWVQFRYNGETHAPDLSVPIAVHKLPRDAKPLTDDECAAYWQS